MIKDQRETKNGVWDRQLMCLPDMLLMVVI
jgi:hypothetical protein